MHQLLNMYVSFRRTTQKCRNFVGVCAKDVSAMHRISDFGQIRFAEFVSVIASSNGFERLPVALASRIISFLQSMTESDSREVFVAAYRSLGELIGDEMFGMEVAALFESSFAECENRAKHAVLNALEQHPERFDEAGERIWEQALHDGCYYIRERAKRALPLKS